MDTETGTQVRRGNQALRSVGTAILVGSSTAAIMVALGLLTGSVEVLLFAPVVGLFLVGAILAGNGL